MLLHKFVSLPLAATVLMAFLGSHPVASFTAIPSRVTPMHISPISTNTIPTHHHLRIQAYASESTTALRMNVSPPDKKKDTDGSERGKYIQILVLIGNIWLFSIPVEFRRAQFCSEEDVRLHPESHCITFASWRKGIGEYYANGGGVNFDFSIEGKE